MSSYIGPMNSAVDLPPTVASYLRDFATAVRRLALIRGFGIAVALFLMWSAISCGLDRLLHLSPAIRFLLLICGGALCGGVVARSLWKLRGRIDWVDIAGQIEGRDPQFSQSLLTVVSQLTGDRTNRGSAEILSHLLRDVELHIAESRRRSLLSLGPVVVPWMVCLVLIASALILNGNPQIGVRQLVQRFVTPGSDLPPVTTTQITVSPGDRDIVQSDPLRIDAQVEHLIGDSVFLFLNTQGDWHRVVMNPTDATHFSYPLASVDRDIHYYVTAGDAATRTFLARVLRRPTVSQFQISYLFPDYVRREPLVVSNTDGLIEAPVGSRATLTIFCSDPLQSAMLTIGAEKILMSRSGDQAARRATITVKQDIAYSLDLISAREVAGSGPPGTRIHPLINRPPVARLFQAGQDVRLTPRDIITLTYQAADDYALNALTLAVKLSSGQTINRPIHLVGHLRGQEGSVDLDLASLPLKVGDLATVTIVASDSAGQAASSEPLRIRIAARPVDLDMRERVSELNAASGFAMRMIGDFETARGAIGQADGIADKQSSGFAAASAHANLSLANASESATLLRQCLCRAILHTHAAQLSVALAALSDSAESLSEAADELFRVRGDSTARLQPIEPALRRAIDQSHRLSADVTTLWQGQLAIAVLAEREDADSAKHPISGPRSQAVLRELNIDPGAAGIAPQLQAKIGAGQSVIDAARPIDYAEAARMSAQELSRGEHAAPGISRRLSAAAEAEAVRPESDLTRARDLQLASKAAAAIESSLNERRPEDSAAAATVTAFASALADLQREWELRLRPASSRPAHETATVTAAATSARQQMISWAQDLTAAGAVAGAPGRPTTGPISAAGRKDAEDIALQASAAAAARDYDGAARLDEALNNRVGEAAAIPGRAARDPDAGVEIGRQRVAASMARARTIDGIGQTQDAVAKQTQGAPDDDRSDLAGSERKVADAIAAVVTERSGSVEPNSRGQAAAAFLSVQEQLAAVPQMLADALAAGTAQRAAAQCASGAQEAETRLSGGATGEERGMAHRAAVEAANEAGEASDRLEAAMAQIDPARAASWADELGAYAPESTDVCNALQTQLVAALTDFARALRGNDVPAIGRAASAVRAAVDSVQRELAAAQDALTARDPLLAARSFAGAAADSLAQSPPDLSRALVQQVRATGALARAWDQSIHDAASHRLSIVPSMQPVYAATAPADAAQRSPGQPSIAGGWERLPPGQTTSMSFPTHDSDPAGYEEPLRIYFQALGKAQAARAEGR